MPVRTIMLDLTDAGAFDVLLGHALPLARRDDAAVIAVRAVPRWDEPSVNPYGMSEIVSLDVLRDLQAKEASADDELAHRFEETLRREGVAGEVHRLDAREGTLASLARVLRNADLVLARAGDAHPPHGASPQALALATGRPVLVVPPSARPRGAIGRRALIAWNGSREAARAAHDALALLEPGAEAMVLAIEAGQVEPGAAFQPGDMLARTLARHGLKVEATTRTLSAGSVGAELLNAAHDWGADMLVMGCYGHSRLREWALGGATRSLLSQVALPTLLSH